MLQTVGVVLWFCSLNKEKYHPLMIHWHVQSFKTSNGFSWSQKGPNRQSASMLLQSDSIRWTLHSIHSIRFIYSIQCMECFWIVHALQVNKPQLCRLHTWVPWMSRSALISQTMSPSLGNPTISWVHNWDQWSQAHGSRLPAMTHENSSWKLKDHVSAHGLLLLQIIIILSVTQ